jgi:hypothetical protein
MPKILALQEFWALLELLGAAEALNCGKLRDITLLIRFN